MKKLDYSPELVKNLPTWAANAVAKELELKAEIEKFHPCTLQLCFNEEKDGVLEYNYSTLFLTGTNIQVNKISRCGSKKDEYYFSIQYQTLYKYIDWEAYKIITDTMEKSGTPAPNNVFVISAKKIEQWKTYLTEVSEHCANVSASRKSNVENFLNSLEGLPVRWLTENIQGSIVKNGIQFSFAINQNNGWITKNMSLHYSTSANLDDFLALSDNKFIQKSQY